MKELNVIVFQERDKLNHWLEWKEYYPFKNKIRDISETNLFPMCVINEIYLSEKWIQMIKDKFHSVLFEIENDDEKDTERDVERDVEIILKKEGFELIALSKDDHRVWFYL